MKQILIVALGNVGEKYQNTRHNAGVLMLNHFMNQYGIDSTASQDKFEGKYWSKAIGDLKVHLLFPQTMMNQSGISVRQCVDFFKLKGEEVVVMYDDLDLEFGILKLQLDKSPHGHNGVLDVRKHFPSRFWHLRIGVEGREVDNPVGGQEYVLQHFNKSEMEALPQIFESGCQMLKQNFLESL